MSFLQPSDKYKNCVVKSIEKLTNRRAAGGVLLVIGDTAEVNTPERHMNIKRCHHSRSTPKLTFGDVEIIIKYHKNTTVLSNG